MSFLSVLRDALDPVGADYRNYITALRRERDLARVERDELAGRVREAEAMLREIGDAMRTQDFGSEAIEFTVVDESFDGEYKARIVALLAASVRPSSSGEVEA